MTGRDDVRRAALEERIRLAEQDIADLQQQVDDGEIDELTAVSLEERYRNDRDDARKALSGMPRPGRTTQPAGRQSAPARPGPSTSRRTVWIAGIAGVVMVVGVLMIVLLATGGDDPMEGDPVSTGSAATGSVAELEAAVAAQPENNAMRLALAHIYFDSGEFMAAMNQYSTVAANNPTAQEASISAARIGWLAFLRLEDTETALTFLDTAIAADPGNYEAVLWTGMVLLYGRQDGAAAAPYFEQILALEDLSAGTRSEVQTMLDEARGGSGG